MNCKFCGNPVVVLGNCCESCGIYRGFIPRKAEELSKDERSKYGLWAEGKGYISYSHSKEDFEGIAEEISTEYPGFKVEIRSLQDSEIY
jgi:hypothetical protein